MATHATAELEGNNGAAYESAAYPEVSPLDEKEIFDVEGMQ